jgi:ABC-type multidrug transport system fused ATPase/permease subunit
MIFCLVVDVVIITIFFYLRWRERERVRQLERAFSAKASRRRSRLAHSAFNARQVGSGVPLDDGSSLAPGLKDVSVLVDAFKRGMNHQDLCIGFKFEDLGCMLRSGKVILQGVTGEIRPGRLTAIMGPSGAGSTYWVRVFPWDGDHRRLSYGYHTETTFMNVLMGKYHRTGGRLWINGREEQGINAYQKIIGFVPQDDIMLRELTVRENILHSARIRLPNNWSTVEVEGYVDSVLEALK